MCLKQQLPSSLLQPPPATTIQLSVPMNATALEPQRRHTDRTCLFASGRFPQHYASKAHPRCRLWQESHPFSWMDNIPSCLCAGFVDLTPTSEHLGGLHLLTLLKNSAENMGVHLPLGSYFIFPCFFFFFLSTQSNMWLLDYTLILFHFEGCAISCSRMAGPFYIPPKGAIPFQFLQVHQRMFLSFWWWPS